MRTITPELQAAINKAAQTAALREKTGKRVGKFFDRLTSLTVKAVVIPTSFVVGIPRILDPQKVVRKAASEGWSTGQKPYVTLETKVETIAAAEEDFLQTARDGNFTDFMFKTEEDLLAGLRKLGVKDEDFSHVRSLLMEDTVSQLQESEPKIKPAVKEAVVARPTPA